MIRLRSKNLVDYERMRAIGSGADISYIDNGWLVGRGSNYGKRIVNLNNHVTIKQGETYYIVADVELLTKGLYGRFVSICLFYNGIEGTLIWGKVINNLNLGESQRMVYKCNIAKIPYNNLTISVYNGFDSTSEDKQNGWSFKVTNLCFFKEDYTIDYVPYWYEPSKIMTKHNGSMSEVKTIAWGVKDECKIVLNGSESWVQYSSGSWVGTYYVVSTNAHNLRDAQYNNYWGFQYYDNPDKFLWLHKAAIFIAWAIGYPPYPSWETTDDNGKAIANIPQIKADLAKRNLVVYYDNTNSRLKTLAGLLKIVRREVYNNFSATVDSDILTLTNSSVENNVLILPDGKTVTNNVLNL